MDQGRKKLEALCKNTMLILPSHSEGLPNVILEAMATKTPIVAIHVGGLKEIFKNNGIGIMHGAINNAAYFKNCESSV